MGSEWDSPQTTRGTFQHDIAAKNAQPNGCYTTIGSALRSFTIEPVNVEPVVPVSSTVA